MAIEFKVTKVNNNMNPDAKPIYYAKAVTKGTVNLDEIIDDLSGECTLTRADIVAVVAGLSKHLIKNLQNGYTVKIDSLGSFSTSVQSTTQDSPKKITPREVSFNKINYLPEVSLLESFRNVQFKKVENRNPAPTNGTRGRRPIRKK